MAFERILIWEQNWLGDVLFSTPFIKAVRKKCENAYIAVMLNYSCKEILEGNPRINEIILYDEKTKHRGLKGEIKLIRRLKKESFDTVFLLHRSLSRALIAYFAGIRNRIGYFYIKRNFILTDIVDAPRKPLHKIEYFLKMAGYIGADISDKNLEFFINDTDREYIENLIKRNEIEKSGPIIAINPGGNWPPKRWPEENFAKLADILIKKYKVRIMITGSENDISRALRIQELAHNKLFISCGKTTLKQLGALYEKAKIVISGDSGPLHIARAVGADVIALFGPTSPELTGPYGEGSYSVIQKDVGCRTPCYNAECSDNKCMKAISVEDVLEAVKKIHLNNQ